MRKTIISFSFLAFFTFLFICMAFVENPSSLHRHFVFSNIDDEPVLPSTPYAYDDIEFPAHLFSDTIETGYGAGNVDTTILSLVSNDGATLGRVLFYDKKLSALENLSCASCHNQASSFAENKAFSQGISALTKRNSMHLNDLGWTSNAGFFWDLSQNDLHTMIGIPLKDENEIGANIDDVILKLSSEEYYNELFTKAYGDSEVTEYRIIDALVQFISSMVTFDSRFDQEADNGFKGFTDKESAGLELFSKSCAGCHFEGGFTFFDGDPEIEIQFLIEIFPFLFTNGLETNPVDLGIGDWMPGFDGLYKVTSLRNIALTAPYMHDGRFETLEEVIDFYSEDVQETPWNIEIPIGGFGFTDSEKESLIAFLETLTDENFLEDVKFSDPFNSVNSTIESNSFDLVLYPNPSIETATISIPDYSGGIMAVEVHDNNGRLIFQDSFESEEYQFNKNAFVSGVYYITVRSKTAQKNQMLIVQ